MDFLIHLLIILLIFWIFGGILKMVLDHFMGEIVVKKEEDSEDSEGEGSDEEAETADSVRETSHEDE